MTYQLIVVFYFVDLLKVFDTVVHDDELVCLYQIMEGVANYSYACNIADAAGLPEDIVERGKMVG